MKTTKKLVGLLAIVAICAITTSAMAESGAVVRYFIVTAPTSANNNESIQNVQSYVDKGGVVGLISTDIASDPAALNMPPILRPSEIIYSAPSLKLWDSVVDPTGAFANENGSRLLWSLDYKDTTQFLASDVYFNVWSSDAANTIRFSGNIATNGSTALTFSPTLRGELWDENGNKIATYYNGETVADHPINRLIAQVRVGWYVTEASQIKLDMDYFRSQMQLTNFVAFYRADGWGVTNWISSLGYLTAHPANGNGDQLVILEGQRHLGLTYKLIQTPSLDKGNVVWTTVATGMTDGISYTNTLTPNAFYRAQEEGITMSPSKAMKASYIPVLKVSNGPE